MTPIGIFALVFALKSDFAALASVESDFDMSAMHAFSIVHARCHFKTIKIHKFYKQKLTMGRV